MDEALPATPARRSAVLFLWSTAPWEPEVIVLAGAKVAAEAGGDNHLRLEGALDQARRLMALWGDRALYGTPQSPVDGESLMNELGLAPGPVLGRVLREIRLAWRSWGGDDKRATHCHRSCSACRRLPCGV